MIGALDTAFVRHSGECPRCGREVAVRADHEISRLRCLHCWRRVRVTADEGGEPRS
jgi:ribosomal protein S27AE